MADEAPSTDAPPSTDSEATAVATTEEAVPADLGDAGKKALDRMKAERDEARRQAKALADAEKRLKEYEDRDKTEQQKLAERAEAAEKAAANASEELKRNKVALRFGLTDVEADDMSWSGTDEEIEARAKRVAESRGKRRVSGDVDQGARDDTRPKQIGREGLKGMSPAEIVAAKKAGQLTGLLTGK